MTSTKILRISAVVFAVGLSGCATNDQGVLVVDPNKVNEIITNALTPPPPAPVAVVAPVVVEDEYTPVATDAYVAVATDRDVVIVGGDTYIWAVGPNGKRERHFFAHGDHRGDVFHRREELHTVMAHHDGHLPDHAIGNGHPPGDRNGQALAHGGSPVAGRADGHAPAGAPMHAAGVPQPAHPVATAKPAAAPAKASSKDPKKT